MNGIKLLFLDFLSLKGWKALKAKKRDPPKGGKLKGWQSAAMRYRFNMISAISNRGKLKFKDVRTNAVGRRKIGSYEEMEGKERSYLLSTQRQSEKVKSYFRAPRVRYVL